ncbi:MAG: amidohydrolase [Fusobacterium sp. JB021]|nr:amidohydrolase [Fusobacterium sp. JB020]MDP0492760.1 amidohydrolase [Fusobacterium sp. JB021]MDP0507073.1 amidohydrolase [Fusobacterium sp. JB019]
MLIKNAKILSYGVKEDIYDIFIEKGKIKSIKKNILGLENEKIIDAKGMYVTPGLIDAHTHLGLKGDSLGEFYSEHNEKNSKISPHLRAIDAINPQDRTFKEAVNAGITTCASGPGSANIIGGQFACIKTYGGVIDSMVINPYIGMKAALGENPKKRYETTRMGIASELREFLLKCQKYLTTDGEYDKKCEAMIPIMKREKPLKIHVHRADDIATAIRISEEFNIKYTLDHVTGGVEILEYIQSKKEVPLLLGPSLGGRGKVELLGKSFENVVKLSVGRDVCLITDAPVIPLQYLPVCAGLAISKGMDYKKAFEAVTINPAKVMGIENRLGSLEEGKDGDVVIWKDKPLVTIQDPIYVIVDGKIIKGD